MEHRTGKRIVITTWGSFGDLHPYMAVALELRRRGHHPVVATMPIYREKVEAAGLAFHPVRPDVPPPEEATELIRRALDPREGPSYLFRELLNPRLRETYEDTLTVVTAEGGADLLVTHQVPLAAPLVAEKLGIRRVSAVLIPMAFVSAYDPPTPPQFPQLQKLAALHPMVARTLLKVGKLSAKSWGEPVQQLRRELGLPPNKNPIFEGQHSRALVLGLFSTVLSKVQPDFPPHTVITGFPFYDRKDEHPVAAELRRFLDAGEPPIVFTLGSSAVWIAEDFYQTSIEAAGRLGQRALLLVGDKRNLPSMELPENIAAFDYAPHSLVMPRARLVVHQGGIGTTGQALRAGRPMLVVPYGQDQPDNARRCTELGVGRTISRARYVLPDVIKEISELLTNKAYSERAAAVGQQVRAENGAARACDAIEEMLN